MESTSARSPRLHAVIHSLANSTPDGFGNFRFATLANCPPHSPFFPVAYHPGRLDPRGQEPAFALATEGAPLALDAFDRAKNLDEARANLIGAVESAAQAMARVANDLAARFSFRFAGIDFSLAPFPDAAHSIGAALEKLTGAKFGEHGTLFAAAFVTDCLRHANFPRAGFSGLMLPVLEDATLAERSPHYSIDSLLLYSTVCGTGLDTVPAPGRDERGDARRDPPRSGDTRRAAGQTADRAADPDTGAGRRRPDAIRFSIFRERARARGRFERAQDL